MDWREQLGGFVEASDRVNALLDGFLPELAWLTDAETLTYLHGTVSTRRHAVAVPEVPAYLDAYLADEPLTGGLEPMLGASHVRVMTVRGFPASTWPGLLDDLNRLGFPYRWTTRFLFLDKADGEKELSRLRRQWFAKRKGIVTLLRETIFQQESPLVDSDAANKAVDADEALQTLGSDQVAFGYITATVVVWDEDPRIAAERLKAVERVIQGRGFTTSPETLNAVEAWLSSIPGHVYANVRQPIVSTLNLAHLMPLSAVWAGPERNEHLDGPPLLITRTEGATPFRLTTHVGDVGHTLIVGPTGAGKSVLLATLIVQFRKYPHSRIYVFDKGRSVRAAMLGLGGQFHDLGLEGGLTFQPLRGVDDPGARAWAAEWVQQLLAHERVDVTPEVKDAVWSALGSLGSAPAEERTLSGLATLLQSNKLRQALQPYTLDGPFGRLLDADHEDLTLGDLQAFEMEDLLHAKSVVLPVLTYLFHRLEAQFDGRPTLLVLDEAWVFLDDPVFASRIREWLKTLRKKNVGVVFATQSLADIQRSAIAPAIVESCPTRIFLPSPQAVEPQLRPIYEGFGLNARQIEMLARATPKRDYYVQSRLGNRLFDLGLGPVALAFVAALSPRDHALIDAALARVAGRLRRDLAQDPRPRLGGRPSHRLSPARHQGAVGMTIKRKGAALGAAFALATTGVLFTAPAHAQWVVYDPTNFSQNVLTAARSLQQINNQIQSLQNEAQMILNQGQMLVDQGKNLASLAYSPMAMLQQDIARTNALIQQAQGLATQVGQLDQQFNQQYPSGYGANTSLEKTVADAQARWNNSLAALHTTLDMQAQVNASITADQGTLSQIVGSSQGAQGILQATQATNQLLALLAKQTMQSQQLRMAQDRATALEQSRTLEADAQAQANRARFMGSGVPYTPVPVKVFPQ